FLGVGGGFVIVPALVVVLRYEMPVAVGTSLLVIALNSVVALLARIGSATLVWHVVLPFTAAAVAGSLGGSRLSGRLDPAALTRAFAVLLLLVAGYVGVRAGLGTA
ncbi:MAG: TSUP family transporter, partial [Mycobacteriales bacterium]